MKSKMKSVHARKGLHQGYEDQTEQTRIKMSFIPDQTQTLSPNLSRKTTYYTKLVGGTKHYNSFSFEHTKCAKEEMQNGIIRKLGKVDIILR